MKRIAFVTLAALCLQGCASFKEFYGEDWYKGWDCYRRYGTDLCTAMEAVDESKK